MHNMVSVLLWLLVGAAKTMALILLLTAPQTYWFDALAWLLLAFGLVAAALLWRARLARLGDSA
ncbi:hypothetical protein [Sandarakinorhabdus sp.]|uniref:hypothetical protein n=1 Tax=Sandarakinorhabdus sp. TaxID=1916663 RepID=UPI00333EDC75